MEDVKFQRHINNTEEETVEELSPKDLIVKCFCSLCPSTQSQVKQFQLYYKLNNKYPPLCCPKITLELFLSKTTTSKPSRIILIKLKLLTEAIRHLHKNLSVPLSKCSVYKDSTNTLYMCCWIQREHVQQSGSFVVSSRLWADRPPLNHDHWMRCCSSWTTWDQIHLQPIKISVSQREAMTQHTHTHSSCESIPKRIKINFVCASESITSWRAVKSAADVTRRFLCEQREKHIDTY